MLFSSEYLPSIFTYAENYPNYSKDQIDMLYLIDQWDFAIITLYIPFIHIILRNL